MEFMEDVLVNQIDEEVEEIKKNFDIEGFEVIGKTMKEIEAAAKATKVPFEMGESSIMFEILEYSDNNMILFFMDDDKVSDAIYTEA